MKLGLFTVPLKDRALPEALKYARRLGCETVELGAGGYPGRGHCDPERLLSDTGMLAAFRQTILEGGLEISALSCHGNPLHPAEHLARAHDNDLRNAVRLAAEIGVEVVVTFSGCPGGSESSERPNWVTCAWPPDFREILDWQWNERVAPYWREAAEFARGYGVKIAIEPHPGFVVYNTESFRRLREVAGEGIGVNLDPSNLFWQQIDPLVAVEELGGDIFHVHAKDTGINAQLVARNGILDTKEHTPDGDRSWAFRVVGRGHGPDFWQAFIRELDRVGYNGPLSIEHEDLTVNPEEGCEEAAGLLGAILAEMQPDKD